MTTCYHVLASRLFALLALLAAGTLLAPEGHTQAEFVCGTGEEGSIGSSFCGSPSHPTACQDTLRALVVFVRFADDYTESSDWPNTNGNGDPIPWTQLPPFGQDIIATSAEEVGTLTPEDSSLSAYFYWQSKNGPGTPHVLFGDVWPRNAQGEPEVWVSDSLNIAYHNEDANGNF